MIHPYVGNAGGYLGLFLGYAMLNLPELIHAAFTWMIEKFMSSLGRTAPSNRNRCLSLLSLLLTFIIALLFSLYIFLRIGVNQESSFNNQDEI